MTRAYLARTSHTLVERHRAGAEVIRKEKPEKRSRDYG